MDFKEVKARKERSKRRWYMIGVGLVLLGATSPIGVGIIVANALDLLPNIGGSADLKRSIANSFSDLQMPQAWQESANAQRSTVRSSKQKKAKKNLPNGALLSAIGAILFAAGVIGGVYGGLRLLINGFSLAGLATPIGWLCVAAGGIVAAIFGRTTTKKVMRFENYLKLIGDKQAVPIHYLADVMGIDYHKVIKDLREMISLGMLQPAWLDLKTYRLMLTDYSEDQFIQPEEKKEEAVSRNDRILRQIRADNDLIADVEVSRKIDRIEDLTRKIFAILDERPEKEEKLYSFLNYYLPTTLKALESYARLEAQGIETASIKEAKQKINHALDELADGYEKQLDKLFEDDVVDITADIDVMRKMLHKDGLKEDEILTAVTGKKE